MGLQSGASQTYSYFCQLGLDSHKKENTNKGTAPLFMLCL